MIKKFEEIGKVFRLEGKPVDYKMLTAGNINSTYEVFYSNEKSYIFQKVNVNVFKNPVGVMKNIELVTEYIRRKYPNELTLHYHHTDSGENYAFVGDEFWRVIKDIKSITFNICGSNEDVKKVGKAFGDFQERLSDFDAKLLEETIPDFHNTKKRLDTLFSHVKEETEETKYLASVREKASLISEKLEKGELPVRVAHNDTKANNVLFDENSHEPLVVIDLDTVMPGSATYDFGDGVRFICNTAVEDEKDLSLVSLSKEKFKAFTEGFLGKVKDVWDKREIDHLVLAVFSVTVELASRFLDDYLTGSKYFKIDYPEHNLVRTRCQIQLAKSIEAQWEDLEKIVQETIKTL